jgi:HAE1 family hydrophobic/amphiphilic exporter-1
MSLPKFSVKHPVTATMLSVGLFLLGIVSLSRIGQELFPNINLPTLIIITVNPGTGPFEIESGISKPIETAVAGINGVERIQSSSMESVSQLTLSFVQDSDMNKAITDVREAINTVEDDFPDGTERAQVFKFSPSNLPSLRLNFYTESQGINIRKLVIDEIIPEIERVPGVAQANVFGGTEQAVLVRLDLESIIKLNISLTRIMQVFQGENISLPGGILRLENQNIVLRTIGEFNNLEDIENVLIDYRDDVPIFLSDIASIVLEDKNQEEFVYTRGTEGIILNIQKQSDFNTVAVNDGVLERLEQLRPNLPPSLKIEVQENQADQVRTAIGGVTNAAWQGGILAIFVLLFFLRNFRSTLIISLVIPLSVIATFSLIDFGGMTLNLTSLMGITLAIGMFVDNAIVVLESIYRKQLQGMNPKEAAVEGAEEVARAITASTLTTVAVFLPMLFVDGLTGLLFKDLSLTISFSLGISLFTALTLIPVLSANFSNPGKMQISADALGHEDISLADVEVKTRIPLFNKMGKGIQNTLRFMDDAYEAAVKWALKHAGKVLLAAFLLLVFSLGSIFLLGMEFLPEADEGVFSVFMKTKVDSTYEASSEKIFRIEEIILQEAGDSVVTMRSIVGDGGSQFAMVNVRLNDKDLRNQSIWEITQKVDKRIEAEILDVEHQVSIEGMAALAAQASGSSSPLEIKLTGDDINSMYEYATLLKSEVETVIGARNIRISFEQGKPEQQLKIKRKEALSLGLSPFEIAATIRAAYNGHTLTQFSTEDSDLDVLMILNEGDRNNLDKMKNLVFINQAGTAIPLENVVQIVNDTGPTQINRDRRARVVSVLGNTTGERAYNRVVEDISGKIELLRDQQPLGVDLELAGSATEMDSSFTSMLFALTLAVILVYMVMASQFESFLNPFIVMFSIPFAIIGLVAALLFTNTTFNVLSFTGAILLAGIVVNNAIVLIDYIRLLEDRGYNLKDAIIRGGKTRLKPILMTSLTTILGLLPMALGIGGGAELRAPMARAVVGGLFTSTLITLILIPTILWVVETKLKPFFAQVFPKKNLQKVSNSNGESSNE